MKKFNLLNEIIVADRSALMQAVNSKQEFGIAIDGAIITKPAETDAILIYRGTMTLPQPSALMPRQAVSIESLFGSDYRIVEDDDRILIKASGAWQQIIGYNIRHCDYDDTTADGVSHFPDEELESIGWHATEFDIGYRDLLEVIETHCDGTLLCIEQEDPYQFSGLGFISDRTCARERTFEFCKMRIAELIEEDEDYAPDQLNDDEREAAEFFELL
jgi:hypothetical protein